MAAYVSATSTQNGSAGRAGGLLRPAWRGLPMQLKDKIVAERLTVIAAGVAFYGLLAFIPTLSAMISIYGLVLDPQHITDQIESMSSLLPRQAAGVLIDPLRDLISTDRGALGLGFAGSLVLALWLSSAGMRALMKALNAAFEVRESRSFRRQIGISFLLALGAIFVVLLAMVAMVVLPVVIGWLGLGGALQSTMHLRWPIVAAAFWIGLVLLYRYGPDRVRPQWSWANWGALIAVLLWLAGSWAFSWYVGNFGNYNRTYGSMGAIVVLLVWFLLSAWAVLIGAAVNAIRLSRSRQNA